MGLSEVQPRRRAARSLRSERMLGRGAAVCIGKCSGGFDGAVQHNPRRPGCHATRERGFEIAAAAPGTDTRASHKDRHGGNVKLLPAAALAALLAVPLCVSSAPARSEATEIALAQQYG